MLTKASVWLDIEQIGHGHENKRGTLTHSVTHKGIKPNRQKEEPPAAVKIK
jgi:hypothetical protein